MKKNQKTLFYIFALVLLGVFTFQGIKQVQKSKWKELQTEIKITPENLAKLLTDAGFSVEDSSEYTGDISNRYGEPEGVWGIDIKTNNTLYTLIIFEYANWEEANHIISYWTEWYKETDQKYKGEFFSHGNLAIFIRPADIGLQNDLKKILLDAHYNP